MKLRTTLISLALVFALSASTFANGLSLNSVGTRALGMGGAFVGLANDGSAIYWNPAGLTGQASSVQLYYTGIMPSANYTMDLASIDASTNSKLYMAPGLFANYTMGKWAFGLGVFVPAGLGTDWNAEDLYGPTAAGKELLSEIGVVSISPAVAYQIKDKFSLGLTVNIYYGMFDLKQPVDGSALGLGYQQFSETSDGTGVGVTIGAKYDFSDAFSAGLSFRTSTKVAMSGDATNTMFPQIPNMPPAAMPGPETSSFSRDVTWPMWIAGGIAYKPTQCLTITFDAQYSQWSELDVLVAEYDDAYWKAVMEAGGDNEFHLKWEDAVQIRLGGEYMLNKAVALRLGYYYDPAPAPDETVNVLFPSSTNHAFTAGFGYYGEKIFVEAGMEYLYGAERDIELNATNEMPGLHQMDVFAFSIGIGYKF
jgi:long-chain fatty acid transport protein